MELDKKTIKKLVGIISFGIILFFLLQNFSLVKEGFDKIMKILSPFLIGAGLAFILNLPLNYFERKLFKPKKGKDGKFKQSKLKRPISIFLSICLILLIVSLVIKIIIPQIINVLIMFAMDVPEIAYNAKEYALDLTKQYPDLSSQIQSIEINWDNVLTDIFGLIKNLASSVVTSSIGFVVSLIGGIVNSIVAIIFAIYILLSKENLELWLKNAIKAYFSEEKAKSIIDIYYLSKKTFYNFITGQFTEACILGILCFIGMFILRIPLAASVSVLIGVTALIPIVGAIVGMLVGAILILSVSLMKALVFIIFLLILQQIETNIIYPKVAGSMVGLPGILVLLAVAVCGSLWGITGLIIGLPAVSVIYTILRQDIENRLKEKE